MGASTEYRILKFWHYGLSFDGINKNNSAKANFGVGGPYFNDFIFAQDKQVASIVFGSASATATPSVKRSVSGIAKGTSTATVLRKLPGVSSLYGRQRDWLYGLTTPTMLKNSLAGEQYWLFGGTDADLFTTSQAAFVFGSSTVSATASVSRRVSGIAIGTSTARVLRKIGGAVDPQGGQKYWGSGLTMGLTFLALGNTVNTANIAKFADQSLWYFGLATPDMIGTVPTPPVVNASPAKMISPQMETKRQMTNWPTSIKIITAAIPTKKSSTL